MGESMKTERVWRNKKNGRLYWVYYVGVDVSGEEHEHHNSVVYTDYECMLQMEAPPIFIKNVVEFHAKMTPANPLGQLPGVRGVRPTVQVKSTMGSVLSELDALFKNLTLEEIATLPDGFKYPCPVGGDCKSPECDGKGWHTKGFR